MENRRYNSGRHSGYHYERVMNQGKRKSITEENSYPQKMDDDLIIEDNTIYEIDRECFERSKKQKRKRD
jgi:hypothetical protein